VRVAEVSKISSKTKSGATILVAVIPQEMAPGLECHHAASDIAVQHGCSHWRVVNPRGQVVALGKAHSTARYGSFGPGER
jgi:hypothetical protein